jgi:hypothetical protein
MPSLAIGAARCSFLFAISSGCLTENAPPRHSTGLFIATLLLLLASYSALLACVCVAALATTTGLGRTGHARRRASARLLRPVRCTVSLCAYRGMQTCTHCVTPISRRRAGAASRPHGGAHARARRDRPDRSPHGAPAPPATAPAPAVAYVHVHTRSNEQHRARRPPQSPSSRRALERFVCPSSDPAARLFHGQPGGGCLQRLAGCTRTPAHIESLSFRRSSQ